MRLLNVMSSRNFQIVFSDIGGVLGSNGWDSALRARVIEEFHLEAGEIERRHHLMFDSYERGFLSLEQYLQHVFFYRRQPFTLPQLREFIFEGSVAWPESIEMFRQVKASNQIKLALISNEGQGITEHRVNKFGLRSLADFMVVSHCVHMRKPDAQIWHLALSLAQVTVEEAVYVDDREMFVDVASALGFTAFQHLSIEQTKRRFLELGLKINQ